MLSSLPSSSYVKAIGYSLPSSVLTAGHSQARSTRWNACDVINVPTPRRFHTRLLHPFAGSFRGLSRTFCGSSSSEFLSGELRSPTVPAGGTRAGRRAGRAHIGRKSSSTREHFARARRSPLHDQNDTVSTHSPFGSGQADIHSPAHRSAARSVASSAWEMQGSHMAAAGGALPGIGQTFSADAASADHQGGSPNPASFLKGLMPKEEIGAEKFLQEHPEYDGRGVVVAIFDTGVDPGAAGLQTTPDGRPKIVDILDCTGSGDIDTSTVVAADADGELEGASGRKLKVNLAWENPTGEWRVGFKRVYELFDGSLVDRLKRERRRRWDAQHRPLVTEAIRQLAAFESKMGKSLGKDEVKRERDELQARVDSLDKLSQSYDDPGPLIDAVVWHDGSTWRAALDTQDLQAEPAPPSSSSSSSPSPLPSSSSSPSPSAAPAAPAAASAVGAGERAGEGAVVGALADFTPMTNFRQERQWGTLSGEDVCNFALNIYDDGAVLSIVTDGNPHGTHVAGITGAYHPEEPALNGVAPGVQLVSCKIGDSRLDSLETGTAVTRALIAVIENKCDLINMSFGEATTLPNHGRFIELANEVVNKHGVIFVSSAGNSGPALTTVGAPGGTSTSIIGIGAYVSPAMATAAHSLIEAPPDGMQYTWSSRGPTADGDVGVDLSAPGGAVASVPTWTLQRRQLMNGTSMASPCACGGIALLLSAVKAEQERVAPHIVRRALENTALPPGTPEDTLTQGRGLLQVDKAYEYMKRSAGEDDMWFNVSCSNAANTGASKRGVYLREPSDCERASEWRVVVKPCFHEDADNLALRVPYEAQLDLRSSAPWIRCPSFMLLAHSGRTFNICVDPTGLPEGLHFGEVCAYASDAPWRGPLFRIPVSVTKPQAVPTMAPPVASFSGLKFSPGHIERRFVAVPEGATWAEASVRLKDFDTPRTFLLHTVQLLPRRRYQFRELKSYLTFAAPTTKHAAFAVEGGGTLEVTLAQFWSSAGTSSALALADVEIHFHGLETTSGDIFLDGSVGFTRVDTRAAFAAERLVPSVTLNRVRTFHRPTEAKLEPTSGARDMLPNGRQINTLTLTYKLSVSEGGKYTPRVPLLNRRVYENEFEAQYYMLFDANKKLLAKGDVYPSAVKLSKGDYTLRMLFRHDNVAHLEKMKKTVLLLDRALDDKSAVKLSSYLTIDGVITGDHSFKSALLTPGERRAFFIAAPPEDKLPKDATHGALLIGKITLGKLANGNGGGGGNGSNSDGGAHNCPAWARVTYVVPLPPKAEDKPKELKDEDDKKPLADRLNDKVRDAKVKFLGSLPTASKEERAEAETFAAALKEEYPRHLPLLSEILKLTDGVKGKDTRPEYLPKVIRAADDVIARIDTDKLARQLAMKSDPEGTSAQKEKKEAESERDALVDALSRKGLALAELVPPQPPTRAPLADPLAPAPSAGADSDSPPADSGGLPASATGESLKTSGAPGKTDSSSKATLNSNPNPNLNPEISPDASSAASSAANRGKTFLPEEKEEKGEAKGAGAVEAEAKVAEEGEKGKEKEAGAEAQVAVREDDAFEANFVELRKWADVAHAKHAALAVARERRAGRPATALKILSKALEDDSKAADKSLYELKVELLEELGFPRWAAYERKWNLVRFPQAYPLF